MRSIRVESDLRLRRLNPHHPWLVSLLQLYTNTKMDSVAHFMSFEALAGVWRELCDTLLMETSLKFPFVLIPSFALLLALAGGRKIGYPSVLPSVLPLMVPILHWGAK